MGVPGESIAGMVPFPPCPEIVSHWWNWHPPVGTFIAFLAVLGVLVPLFRDWGEIGKREKAVWTIIMFVLLGLELRTLYLDREEHDREQAYARCEQLREFNQIATTLGNAIATSQWQFKATMQQFSETNKSTLDHFSGISNNERRRFNALVNKDMELSRHEEQLADAQTGILTPSNEPTPPIPCGSLSIPPDAITAVLEQGDLRGYAIFQSLPHVIVESRSHGPVLSVDRTEQGNISVVLDLRSNDGKIIARVNKNGYVINRNNTLEIRKDQHSLDVIDLYGIDVLSLRYLNPKTLLIKGANIGLLPMFQDWCAIDSQKADISVN